MKNKFILIGILIMGHLSAIAGDSFEIKIGNATLKGALAANRSSSAPDIPVRKEFDICSWLDGPINHKHNAQRELLRKLWDFKRIFRPRFGSLVFTISLANNIDYENSLQSYYQWISEGDVEDSKRVKENGNRDNNYGLNENHRELEINNHEWLTFSSDNNSRRYYYTLLDKNIVLRLNLRQRDNRKNAVEGQWHPEAEKMAKQIIESIELSLPSDGKLCN